MAIRDTYYLPESEPAVTPVAADFTILLEASNFLRPLPSQRFDKRSVRSFEQVATSYCNGAKLYLPLQKNNDSDVPILVDLWRKSGAVETVPNLELPDEEVAKVLEEVKRPFAEYVESVPSAVACWIRDNFVDEVVLSHLSKGNGEAILRVSDVAQSLLASGALRQFENALRKLESEGLCEPEIHREIFPTGEIRSLIQLAVAYALSVSIRGLYYAFKLGTIQPTPVYHYHWIRRPVLTSVRRGVDTRRRQIEASDWIPWGLILSKAFDLEHPATRRNPNQLMEIMSAIRDRNIITRDQLNRLPYVLPSRRLCPQEELLLQTLSSLGIEPLFKEYGSKHAGSSANWLSVLRAAAKAHSSLGFVGLAVELVAATIHSKPRRAVEKATRILFKLDTFWDVFDDLNIPKALRLRESAMSEAKMLDNPTLSLPAPDLRGSSEQIVGEV